MCTILGICSTCTKTSVLGFERCDNEECRTVPLVKEVVTRQCDDCKRREREARKEAERKARREAEREAEREARKEAEREARKEAKRKEDKKRDKKDKKRDGRSHRPDEGRGGGSSRGGRDRTQVEESSRRGWVCYHPAGGS
ncbi:hypothetical protein F5Y04DRAFT_288963 [Hypomontagnella monticulosa]|nr:hypothetical protein F5Y04DRAFT_288963 [Hypomontagnella monticulosa]